MSRFRLTSASPRARSARRARAGRGGRAGRRAVPWLAALALGVGAASGAPGPLAAQGAPRCDPSAQVRDIRIHDSRIEPEELLTVLATRRPTLAHRLLRLGDPPCLDSLDLAEDALRIAVLHRQRGWFTASVRAGLEPRSRGVLVRFDVTPGPQARVRSVALHGLPPDLDGALVAPLRALEGAVFDRVRVQDATDRVVGALQDAGFARTRQPASEIAIDTAAAAVALAFTFAPGTSLRLGAIDVDVTPVPRRGARFEPDAVRRLAGLVAGAPFRARDLLAAQRALYRTEAFRLVLIDTVTSVAGRADSTIDLRIAVTDARTRTARVGAGWGTLECGRVQGRIADRGFLGPGRRVELTARASRLGIGRPVDQFPGLCPQFLRDDPYSQELNYYLGVSLTNQTFFGLPVAPAIDVYSERRGEYNAFQEETDLGIGVALTRALSSRTLVSVGTEFESGRIVTDAVLACVRFALCQPTDFALARQGNATRALNLTWLHDRVGATADPRDGGRLRADVRVGDTRFGELVTRAVGRDGEARRTNAFVRPTIEAAGFTRLAAGTLAARVQWSQVYAPGAFRVGGVPFLPPQERLFSGGQNSVRGYQQNLLGPVVYRVDRASVDSVPLRDSYQLVVNPGATVRVPSPEGGTGSLLANLEYRRRFPWPTPDLQWAVFVDAGTVWATGVAAFAAREVRTTPGLGVRLDTPLGPFRVDIGYNPRRADAGKAFLFDAVTRAGGQRQPVVICVSPEQTLTFDEQVAVGGLACPRTFRPAAGRSVLSRLVFHFSLGQAF